MPDRVLDIAPLPPAAAIDYFQAKGYKLSFDWHDLAPEDHARDFTVAKVTKVSLLEDIRAALDKAQESGTTFDQFKKDLIPTLQRAGWWGRSEAVNAATGELREVQLGSLYRLRTIFNVNIQTSLQVGHYRAMTDPAVLKARPYWRYSAVMDGRTRPMHAQWNGIILPADSPWGGTHFPPNGWNCRCTVVSMSARELERDGLQVSPEPETKYVEWTNPGTGEVQEIPQGIDPGWAYNPGQAAAAQIQAVAGERVVAAPAPLRWQLLDDLRNEKISTDFTAWADKLLAPENQLPENKWKVPGTPSYRTTGATVTVDHLSQHLVEELETLGVAPETTAISITDSDWFHLEHGEQPKGAKRKIENVLTREQSLMLPELLRGSKAVVWDTTEKRLLYVFDAEGVGRSGKAVIAVNFKSAGSVGNSIRSAGIVGTNYLSDGNRYAVLEGKL